MYVLHLNIKMLQFFLLKENNKEKDRTLEHLEPKKNVIYFIFIYSSVEMKFKK